MAWTNQAKNMASYATPTKGGYKTVGDMTEDEFIDILGSAPTFDTPIPGSGGKTFGQLAFDDKIDATDYDNQAKNTASFTNTPKSA